MYKDKKVLIGNNDKGEEIFLYPGMANRHGLIAGATGTGKTVTLKGMAESFSAMGVPVFLADVKGDLAGCCLPGNGSAYPVTFWDIYGKRGIQLRTTISEMGPLLLSRILSLNETQSDILKVVFKIADDEGLLLIDTKDLKAMLNYVSENHRSYEAEYGKMSGVSITAIIRALVSLETAGGDVFFGEPAINITDLFSQSEGKGMINILDCLSLVNDGVLYSTFLLYMMSELFETLPEVGDLDKPKMVFFFDEAHLLFNGASKALLEKIEQVVKLIRSKGVGIFFITQNPRDIPEGVLAQLGNRVQHALHAYTPAEQKSVKAAAEGFRENPDFNTYEAIMQLGTGEAIVSFPDEKGVPGMAQKVFVLMAESFHGSIDDSEREKNIKSSFLYSKYAAAVDPDSAYEFLQRKGLEKAEAEENEKELAAAGKRAAKEKEAQTRQAKKAAKSLGTTVAGTVGREVGKSVGKSFGSFGKILGGNVGASLGRGILSTLFKI
ncbi:MAG: DUF853 domain-containing protein [Lachnospiraceae bacterium]|nr:DUF853 domain-containing protein [Lachnospiraceae bacterium]